MTKAEWLARYDALSEEQELVTTLYEQAESGLVSYAVADEKSADLNEKLADLADDAAELLRHDREEAEDIL